MRLELFNPKWFTKLGSYVKSQLSKFANYNLYQINTSKTCLVKPGLI